MQRRFAFLLIDNEQCTLATAHYETSNTHTHILFILFMTKWAVTTMDNRNVAKCSFHYIKFMLTFPWAIWCVAGVQREKVYNYDGLFLINIL